MVVVQEEPGDADGCSAEFQVRSMVWTSPANVMFDQNQLRNFNDDLDDNSDVEHRLKWRQQLGLCAPSPS